MYFTSLSTTGEIDGCLRDQIFSQFQHSSAEDCDFVGLGITHMNGWDFNEEEFNRIKSKRFIIFDFTEYGWSNVNVQHIYGRSDGKYDHLFSNKNYLKLNKALKDVDIRVYFKRELPKALWTPLIQPIEYPCLFENTYIEPVENYINRPIDIFFNWGWSNPSRPSLHAAFYRMAEELNFSVVSDIRHVQGEKRDHPNRPLVLTQFTPHHSRFSMNDILRAQSMSKISVSLNGCGVKCFRHEEAPVNSLMALQDNVLEWTYPWNEENSIVLPPKRHSSSGILPGKLSEDLTEWENLDADLSVRMLMRLLNNPKHLHSEYVMGIQNCQKYLLKNYIPHLKSIIQNS